MKILVVILLVGIAFGIPMQNEKSLLNMPVLDRLNNALNADTNIKSTTKKSVFQSIANRLKGNKSKQQTQTTATVPQVTTKSNNLVKEAWTDRKRTESQVTKKHNGRVGSAKVVSLAHEHTDIEPFTTSGKSSISGRPSTSLGISHSLNPSYNMPFRKSSNLIVNGPHQPSHPKL
jgi:hypothetical protein